MEKSSALRIGTEGESFQEIVTFRSGTEKAALEEATGALTQEPSVKTASELEYFVEVKLRKI